MKLISNFHSRNIRMINNFIFNKFIYKKILQMKNFVILQKNIYSIIHLISHFVFECRYYVHLSPTLKYQINSETTLFPISTFHVVKVNRYLI